MTQRPDVLVIGGGVIGVCSAYYLQQEGRRVVLLDKGEVASGSSYGNAGWLVPSHSMPLARPGAISEALQWILSPVSPFYIKPRPSIELVRWLWRFRAAANAAAVGESLRVACELSRASLDLYSELISKEEIDCHYERKGLIAAYATQKGLEEGVEEAEMLAPHGVSGTVLDRKRLSGVEPALSPDLAGGVLYDGDAHLKPDSLVCGLAARFEAQGGTIRIDTEVHGFEVTAGSISSVRTSRGDYAARQVVLATGAWSSGAARGLGLDLPVQPAKGYSITFERPIAPPSIPVMLSETRVGVTPMGPVLRFAGTLELSGLNTRIDRRRVDALRQAGSCYLNTDLSQSPEAVWCGMRPLTPDTLPIIGAVDCPSNLIVATGHSMTGVTLGAATGKLVAQIAASREPLVDPAPFSPMRFQ